MKVDVGIDDFLRFVVIGRISSLLLQRRDALLSLFENAADFGKCLLLIILPLPAEDLIEDDLVPSAGDVAPVFDLLMVNAVVEFVKDFFFEAGDEREEGFVEDASGDQHRDQSLVIDFDELLDQVKFISDDAVLKHDDVVEVVGLATEIRNRNDSDFPN